MTFVQTMPDRPAIYLPVKGPSDYLQFGYDASADITAPDGTVDPIIGATLTVRPSGELQLTALSVDVSGASTVISWWESGGVAGREYQLLLTFATAGQSVYTKLLGQLCDPAQRTVTLLPSPPSFGYGTAITWP